MLATPQAFVRDPSLVWEFYHWRREVVSRCQPNAGHLALAAFEQQAQKQGIQFAIITQNIDRLHQAAGSQNVIELHGSLWDVCVATPAGFRDPGQRPWEDRSQPLVPALADSGDPLGAPADIPVVWQFTGGSWVVVDMATATTTQVDDLLDVTDLLLVIGTSSVVYPAAGYAPQVAQRGVPVVEINMEATGNSRLCTMSIQGKAGHLLQELLGVMDDPQVIAAMATATAQHLMKDVAAAPPAGRLQQ
eukprot:gene7957-8155_t